MSAADGEGSVSLALTVVNVALCMERRSSARLPVCCVYAPTHPGHRSQQPQERLIIACHAGSRRDRRRLDVERQAVFVRYVLEECHFASDVLSMIARPGQVSPSPSGACPQALARSPQLTLIAPPKTRSLFQYRSDFGCPGGTSNEGQRCSSPPSNFVYPIKP